MIYQKQNFANGEVLTASQLNHIEDGIADVESAANENKDVVDKIIDPTLSLSGKAADAAKVGEAINAESERAKGVENQLKEDLDDLSDAVRDSEVHEALNFNTDKTGWEYNAEDSVVKLCTVNKGEKINFVILRNNAGGILYLSNSNNEIIKAIEYSPKSFGVLENTKILINHVCDSDTTLVVSPKNNTRGGIQYKLTNDTSYGTVVDFISATISDNKVTYTNKNMKIVYTAIVSATKYNNYFLEKRSLSTIIVDKNGYGSYKTIQEAVQNADDTEDNPITIIVMPGIYEEFLNIYGNRHLRIIGINKKDCVLVNKTGKYLESTLRVDGDFMIKNMTILATMEKAGSWLPSDNEQSNFGAYALHIDDPHESDENKYHTIIDNCIIYSECHCAIAVGLHKNTTVEITNCEIENNLKEKVIASSPIRSKYGALFVHSDVTQDGTGGKSNDQTILVKNCNIRSNTEKVIKIQLDWNGDKSGNSSYYGFYHNSIRRSDNTVSEELVDIDKWYNSNTKMSQKLVDSYGNNISILNYSGS